ncbi:MAG: hypothetical protein ACOYJB_09525 [Christensenellaceae bacterium]
MEAKKNKKLSIVNIVSGGLSFLLLLPNGQWWLGAFAAGMAFILARFGLKSTFRQERICAGVSIALAVAGIVVYILFLVRGYSDV